MIRAMAREAYCRNLELSQRIKYVHNYLLAKVWYTAQIFPVPDDCVRQLNSAITSYIWHGEIFRVPLSTLQRCKTHGGWDLIDVAAKSRALFYARLRNQGLKVGTLAAAWLQKWDLLKPGITPPPPRNRNRIPEPLDYLRLFAIDTAYILPPGQYEPPKSYKRRIYNTLRILLRPEPEPPEMRIFRLMPTTD
jgi:hypothetical protein